MKVGKVFGIAAAGATAAWALRKAFSESVDLTGQTALVTGGSRGLGFLLARRLVNEGCNVVICARDREGVERARRELEGEGTRVLALRCDVGDNEDVRRMMAQISDEIGPVDILVNNAGVIEVGPVEEMEIEDFQEALDVMYWGVLNTTLEVLPDMLRRDTGRIVNITSIGGKVSVPHLLPYNSAKFAAVGLSEGLRAELADSNVSVTTIAPGLMRTGSYRKAKFKGNHRDEYRWFSLGASLPGISIDAERAADKIVDALKSNESERILTPQARLMAMFHGMFPGFTADLLGNIANLILPKPTETPTETRRGEEIEAEMPEDERKWYDRATYLGQQAAERFQL